MYDKTCRQCGYSLSEFYRTGILGCPACYKAFAAEIKQVVAEVQGGEMHVGKTPKVNGVDKELLTEYRKLLSERELAGLEGRFADMAALGREILLLKEELEKRGLI